LAAAIVSLTAATPALAAQLTLTWTDNASDESGFRIERRFDPAGSYSEITTVGPDVTSYVDTTVTAGQDYCYRIRAYNSAGTSEYSNEACRTPAALPSPVIITGTGSGGGPHVRVLDGIAGASLAEFFPYDPAFAGGVHVAAGDVTGDGVADLVTAPGPGGGPHVQVFDGAALRTGSVEVTYSFFAYDPSFTGGVFVAAADVNGDGRADLITSVGPGGGPHVRVFDGATGAPLAERLGSFFAYDPSFTGGVFVAAADVNGDGRADIITSVGPGGGPHIKVFDGATGITLATPLGTFFAYSPGFTGGVFVAGAP
jgi:hypothetical protein